MDFNDFIIPAEPISCETWQLGSLIETELKADAIALLFVSEYRGANRSGENLNFSPIRRYLYHLSKLDFDVPICDLGDLISGKTLDDTHYILQEVLSACHYKNTIPVIIGGSADLSYSLFSALNFHRQNINYTQISNKISLYNQGDGITERNYLNRIFSTKNFSIRNFHLLGYQKHLNEVDSVQLMKEVEFDVVRLAEMMGSVERTEPYFRAADLVTVDCDAIESFGVPFSIHSQVNGLNRREICAYMKEIGLSKNLYSVGLFNYNVASDSRLNHQLFSQMIWYLIEGINIQKTHPAEKEFETFWVMVDDQQYAFTRGVFTNLWYFGEDDKGVPCSRLDYEEAKRGFLPNRLSKYIE